MKETGVYQIYAKAIKQEGIGDLHAKFEELKKKLEEEGLFDKEHKKQIPFMPKVIGVLSASTGAVIKDIINVATRRNPNVYIKLYPVPVQGQGAAEKIAGAIEIMNKEKTADVLILARGGGSLEDLWPFNEEAVARAIYNSEIPIISAVGHETDYSISDFVADLRAPTPSAAAELAVPNIAELELKLKIYKNRLQNALLKKLEVMKLRYEKCMTRRVFTDPLQKINENYMLLDKYSKQIENSILNRVKESRNNMVRLITKLDTLSPLKTLTRGYSIVTKIDDKKIIKSVKDLKNGDKITIKFADGEKQGYIG